MSFGVDRIVSWGRTFGGDGFDDIRGIAAAPSEGGGAPDIIVTGGFVGEMDVGARVDGGQRVQTGGISTAGFLARLDGGTGQTRWATSFHGLRSSQPLALSTSDSVAHVAMLADSAVTLGRDEPPNPEEGRAGEQTVAGGGAPDAILADFDLANGLYRRGEGHGGGGADDGYFGVSALADGGFLVSGGFSGNAFIGLDAAGDPVTLSTTGVRDGVLVNHGPDGHARWARQAAGPGDSLIVQAFAGVDGAIATAGVSTGAVTLGLGEAAGGGLAGETVVGASGQLSLLVTGHDEDGRFRWHRTATGQGFLFPLQISPSAAGTQLLVSGYVDGDGLFRFGSDLQSITALADQSVGYAARYELADGALSSLLEVRADPGGVRVTGSTQTPDGDTLIAGVFDGLLRLVDPPVEARGEDGAGFLARLAPDGQVRWISIMSVEGGLDFGRLRYTEIDGRPAVFLTGFVNDYGGAAQFGPPRDERDPLDVGVGGFLARVDAESGDLVWLQMLATGARGVEIIGLDASGDSVAIAGTFRRSVILAGEQREGAGTEGERELVPRGNDDLFTALYRSRDGVMQWVRQVGGTSEVEALSVAILQDGSVVAAGRFQGVATVVGAGELPDREIDAREGEEGLIVRWLP